MRRGWPVRVQVFHAPRSRAVWSVEIELELGASAGEAVARSGVQQIFPELVDIEGMLAVRGVSCTLGHRLRDGDRVEICRPLQVDPKVARRTRFARQGAGTAGLFARRRPGAKPGY